MKQIVLAALLALLLTACGSADDIVASRSGFLLDTAVTVTIYGSDDAAPLDEAFRVCERYEALFSRTVPDSDVSRINRAEGADFTPDPETLALIRQAVDYARLTAGKYDITICPVVELWDFSGSNSTPPDREAIQGALARVGWENIVLEGQTVRLEGGAQIDLGSIAKGYIADKMAESLRENGVESAIINLGGDVVCVGTKPSGTPYRIGIQKPFAAYSETVGTVELADRAVASSGIYERCFEHAGTLYHHILDVDTGYPADTGLSAVTVIADRAADADALSTCLFLLGPEEGAALAERLDRVEAAFLERDGTVTFTSGFSEELNYKAA